MPREVIIPIRKFGEMITNPQSEDIPDFSSEFNLNVDPVTQSQLRGIPDSGAAITAAGVNLPDITESAFIDYEILGTEIRDLVYLDKEDNDITVISDFYNAKPVTITSSTNATPIVVTTATAHHLNFVDDSTDIGIKINISGHTTNTNANGNHYAKWLSSTTFALYSDEALTSGIVGVDAGADGTVNFPAFFDIVQSPTGTVSSIKVFNDQVLIGLGIASADAYPYTVYRLIKEKKFFNNNETAAAGLYSHFSMLGHTPIAERGPFTIASATLSGAATGYFQDGALYSWRCSKVYDGIEDSELSEESTDTAVGTDDTCAVVVRATSAVLNFDDRDYDKRVTAVKVWRAESFDTTTENLGLYRLVTTIDINNSDWVANGNNYEVTYTDTGGYPEGGQTYEEETGIPETLGLNKSGVPVGVWLNYTINEVGGGYHWMGGANVPWLSTTDRVSKGVDWTRYVFRSKKFRPNMVNWLTDFVVLPEIPIEFKYYNDKLYVLTENNLYKINPELLIIEDVFEGVGISVKGGIVVTEYGMFFCNINGAYRLFNNQITTISDVIKDSLGNFTVSWTNFAKNAFTTPSHLDRIIVGYLSDKSCVVFIGNDGQTSTTLAFIYYLPVQGWFTWNFGDQLLDTNSGLVTGKDGELYWSGTTTLNKLLGGTGNESTAWASKEFTLGKPSQNKSWKKLKWDSANNTGAVVVKYNTNGGNPVSGTTATNDAYINIYKKTFQTYITTTNDATMDSLDILARELVGNR